MIDNAPDSGAVAVESPAQPVRRPRPPRRAGSPRIVLTTERISRDGDITPDGDAIRKLSVASLGAGHRALLLELMEDYSHDPDSYWVSIEMRGAVGASFGDHLTAAEIDFLADQFVALRSRARALGMLPAPVSTWGSVITVGQHEDCAGPDWPEPRAPRFVKVDTGEGTAIEIGDSLHYAAIGTGAYLRIDPAPGSDFADLADCGSFVPFALIDRLISGLITARDRALTEGILPRDGAL
jgi:hypothetical protein